MLIKALEKIIINGTIIDAGETYDGTAEEPEEIPEEIPEEKPKTTRRTVRRTKKTGA